MREATGNLWTYPADVRVITTNGAVRRDGAAVMGRGCALEATQRYPGIEFVLGDRITKHGNHVFVLADNLVSFPVKHHWRDAADLRLIARSLEELDTLITVYDKDNVVLPRPGCGNGRLSWTDVRPVVAQYLDDRYTVITFG